MTSSPEWLQFAPPPRQLTGTQKYSVFLSYRSVNRPWVINLYDVLRQQGHTVYLDQVRLKAGDDLRSELRDGLQASQAGVLIWSKAAADSEWVERELNAMDALARKKQGFSFVPIKLDATDLDIFTDQYVFLDFSSYPDGPNGGELLRLLHAIVGLPLTPEAARFASEQDTVAADQMARIKAAIANGDASRLKQLFEGGGVPWKTSSALGAKTAEGLTRLGRNDDAIQILETLEKQFPLAIRPKQLRALALARRGGPGDLEDAQDILSVLMENGEKDPETLGILGRTWMDRYMKSCDLNHLKRSRDLYAEAFAGAPDDYYSGINAAAKSVFLGSPADLEKAAGYALQVQQIVGSDPKPRDYWHTATVGEVFLIQKKYKDAARLYEAAVSSTPDEIGSHKTTWIQACRLMRKLAPTDEERALIRAPFSGLPDCAEIAQWPC